MQIADAMYQLVALVVAAVSIVGGYRKGLTGQVPDVLGFAFGLVTARVLSPVLGSWLVDTLPFLWSGPSGAVMPSVVASSGVYLAVFYAFRSLTAVLRRAMEVFDIGVPDSLLGAAFGLTKYMTILSIIYNLLLCINPDSRLMRWQNANDGNIVEEVLALSPALLGGLGAEELSHQVQLREARKISCNQSGTGGVINLEPVCFRPKDIIENA